MLKEILTELGESQEMIRSLEVRTFDLIQKLASLKRMPILNDDMIILIDELIRDVCEINKKADDLCEKNLDLMLMIDKKIRNGGE